MSPSENSIGGFTTLPIFRSVCVNVHSCAHGTDELYEPCANVIFPVGHLERYGWKTVEIAKIPNIYVRFGVAGGKRAIFVAESRTRLINTNARQF